jgi:holin-like protein
MVRGFSVLLVFQLAGEVLTRVARLPVPGPVLGMILLLGALELRAVSAEPLRVVSSGLLSHLSILFVPAGVGIMQHTGRLSAEWPSLAVALVVSTAATIAATGWIAARLSRGLAGEEQP